MTRNIPQPIWCIGPQKVRVPRGFDVFLLRFRACPDDVSDVTWFSRLRSFNRRSALRTDTILFIKAGCDSHELYDKPTLMVKACPASRQDASICVFRERCLGRFLFIEISERWWLNALSRSFNLASNTCLLRLFRILSFSFFFFFFFISFSPCLDPIFDGDSFSAGATDRAISPRDFQTLYTTSGRTNAAWKTR